MKSIRFLSVTSALFLFVASQSLAGPTTAKVQGPTSVPFGSQVNSTATLSASGVNANGTIVVGANLKTNGFLPNDANIKMKIELLKPDGSVAVSKNDVVVKNAGTSAGFSYQMKPGEENMGNRKWTVKVTNTDTVNHRDGQATIVINYLTITPPQPVSVAVAPSAPLVLLSGQSAVKTFTEAKAGKITIEATWDTDLGGGSVLNPVSLGVKLFKPGVDPNIGSSIKTANGRSKLTLTYIATSADVSAGSKWSMKIDNPNQPGITNFKVTVTFLAD